MSSALVLLVELAVLFVGVSFLVEILRRRLGPDRLRSWMGGGALVAALKGVAIGFLTPFCTYSALPLLVGMRQARVPPAGYIAFISAAPVLDPILFGALWLIVGPTVAFAYLVVTCFAAVILALAADRIGVERHLKHVAAGTAARRVSAVRATQPLQFDVADRDTWPEECDPWRGPAAEARGALRASWALLRSFGPLLITGVAVGIAIEAFVSPDAAARLTTGSPWTAIPVAAALGTPLYFNTELFVPIANSLFNAGVGVGAIVALTIAGAGANLPEFVVLSKMAKPAAVAVFFGYVFAVAMTGGLLAHTLGG